jgi:hypothetical protein
MRRGTLMVHFRLNLPAIQSSLRDLQRDFHRINEKLDDYRDPLTDKVVANMMGGYDRVDRAIADGTDFFALGNSRRLLELNDLVLCGGDKSGRVSDLVEILQRRSPSTGIWA